MGAFTSIDSAVARGKVLESLGVAIPGTSHAERAFNGVIRVRFLRPMTKATLTGQDSVDGMNKAGCWDSVDDDSAT
jgi:hypothetical protein